MKLLFDAIVRIFISSGTTEAPFYNQTTLFYNQIVSPSLLFHVNVASEPAMLFPRRKGADNSELSYRNSIVHSLLLLCYLDLFMDCLARRRYFLKDPSPKWRPKFQIS